MKKMTRIFMMLLICFALAGCSNKEMGTSASNTIEKDEMQNTATGNGISEKSVNDNLTEDDIISASVMSRSGCIITEENLSHNKIKKFASLFNKVSLAKKMESSKEAGELNGQYIQFDLTLRDNTEKSVIILSPYIIYDGTTYKADYNKSYEQLIEFADQIFSKEKVSYQCDAGSISFYLPDGWSHKTNKYKKISDDKTWGDNETFEITFWKNKSKNNKICIQYTKHFGACGTGAETKKTKINGMSAEAVYYDGKPYWEHIYFLKEYENFVILNSCDDEEWWGDNGDQVMEILDTLTLEKNG